MRKVIDTNCLREPSPLRAYLAKSQSNVAVLPDYVSMEAYKGDIYKSMSVLADFPQQVIILKGTAEICSLSGRGPGLQKRLIDARQTREFPTYCRRLSAARHGDSRFQDRLVELGKAATDHFEKIRLDAAALPELIEEISESYTREELKLLRSGTAFTDKMRTNLEENILRLAVVLFGGQPTVRCLPSSEQLPNTFLFRIALCNYLLVLDRIAEGGANGVKASSLRNDMVDATISAYATFFDGLLSKDWKAQRIYQRARMVCSNLAK